MHQICGPEGFCRHHFGRQQHGTILHVGSMILSCLVHVILGLSLKPLQQGNDLNARSYPLINVVSRNTKQRIIRQYWLTWKPELVNISTYNEIQFVFLWRHILKSNFIHILLELGPFATILGSRSKALSIDPYLARIQTVYDDLGVVRKRFSTSFNPPQDRHKQAQIEQDMDDLWFQKVTSLKKRTVSRLI